MNIKFKKKFMSLLYKIYHKKKFNNNNKIQKMNKVK